MIGNCTSGPSRGVARTKPCSCGSLSGSPSVGPARSSRSGVNGFSWKNDWLMSRVSFM